MATIIDPRCKQCRRAGEKLFLKGDRCFTSKCAVVKRAYPPGRQGRAMGQRRRGRSEYGQQLFEKQRVKRTYGILERQLKKYFRESELQKGDTRENLMRRLEMRLDNVVFRMGWTKSRSAARQLVGHGHLLLNGRRMTIPSCQVKVGDTIVMMEKIKRSKLMENLPLALKKVETPAWFMLDKEKIEGKILHLPAAEDLGDLSPVGLIVESYSR